MWPKKISTALFLIFIGLGFLIWAASGYRSGEFKERTLRGMFLGGGRISYTKDQTPLMFWATVSSLTLAGVSFLALGVYYIL